MANIRDRNFGYEFETSTPLDDLKKIAKPIIESVYGKRRFRCSSQADPTENNNFWHLKIEPSSETELCTPISTTGDLTKIAKVASLLKKEGVKITDSDSLHVHVSAEDVDPRVVLATWIQYESAIKNCFPQRRWKESKNAFNVEFIKYKGEKRKVADFLQDALYDSEFGNCLLNFEHYKKRKTIEFRISEGTLEEDHVKNWAKFCIYFVNKCKSFDAFSMLCNNVNKECAFSLSNDFSIKDNNLINWIKDRYEANLK
jgi:hypothetical protein